MDKYEYNLKLDQMKSLCAEDNYESAAEIADTINWSKVKNVNALVRAGEIYEKVERYEDSRDILLMAYDRSPIGRMIIYRLADVAVKMQDYAAAQEYYAEFVEIAPHDSLKFVLRYRIQKAQGADYKQLIPILEELKEQEYSEEWAYELAYLYHKSGDSEKCIEACDELILWFGDGTYVERALELKMLYHPLSKAQEEKYRKFRLEKKGITSIDSEEMERAGEYAHAPVEIPQVSLNPERFNTVNLQEEIAKGMQQIIDATEKETVSDTMDSIKKIVEDIPYLQLPREDEIEVSEEIHIETDEEIDGSLKINFQELLGEESDGQISLVMSEKAQLEQQITGQMTIEDVLEEWEKTKRAAETALEDAKQRKLESAKARALQEAGDIMDRLNDVLPKLDAGITPKELLEEEYLQNAVPEETLPIMEELVEPEPAVEEIQEVPVMEELVAPEEVFPVAEDPVALEETFPVAEDPVASEETFPVAEDSVEPEEALIEEVAEEVVAESPEEEEVLPEIMPIEEEILVQQDAQMDATRKMPSKLDLAAAKLAKRETSRLPEIMMPEDLDLPEEEKTIKEVRHLTDEQKAVFSYFVPVKGMEDQLCQALTGVSNRLNEGTTAKTGNVIIQGGQGCGKTVLATSFIKAIQKETGKVIGKVGKIDALSLNQKDIQSLLRKVAGGCLIIEHAGDISKETAITLSLLMEHDSSGMLVILEDTTKGIKKALSQDEGFAKKFSETIHVPIFTNDELISFARSYSNELGYELDEMAVLALYNRISNIQRLDQATTLTEVKEIVDEAIEREARGGIKKAISILTAKRYTDDDRILLREKDFE